MTRFRLLLRSLFHFRRTTIAVLLGATIASAVLTGALVVGDSVRASLKRISDVRLGDVQYAVVAGDRLVRDALADDLQAHSTRGVFWSAVLQMPAVAVNNTEHRTAHDVSLIGCDSSFWGMGPPHTPNVDVPDNGVAISTHLAQRLDVGIGNEVLFKVPTPSLLPRDMLLASDSDASTAIRLTVTHILSDDQFGRFSLRANQAAPLNAFVSRDVLQRELALEGKANLILMYDGDQSQRIETTIAKDAPVLLAEHWTAEDAQLEVVNIPERGQLELRSPRVFLGPKVESIVAQQHPDAAGVLTYFVNELRVGDRSTPYSTVAAVGRLGDKPHQSPSGPTPVSFLDWRDDLGVDINTWLAEDLDAKPGDKLTMSYFVIDQSGRMVERESEFRIRRVVPLSGFSGDATLMPDYPGLADSENCADWDPGIEIDLDRIRDKDEAYWDEHRGTPKAFIPLERGRALWSTRYGSLTAVRFLASEQSADEITKAIISPDGPVTPTDLGLTVVDVRTQANAAASQGTDFGGLFLGLSFFLVAAAVLLTALLQSLSMEQRQSEAGMLLALGWTSSQVRRQLLFEGTVVAVVAAALGAVIGPLYTRSVLRGLTTVWADAVADAPLVFAVTVNSLVIGFVASVIVAVAAMAWTLRRHARRSPREMMAATSAHDIAIETPGMLRAVVGWAIAAVCVPPAIILVAMARNLTGQQASGMFFGVGALVLIAGLGASQSTLAGIARRTTGIVHRVASLGVRSTVRRRGRSLAVVALLACGCFLVMAVGVNRLPSDIDMTRRQSGTGGFVLYARTTLPVLRDLREPAARDAYAMPEGMFADVGFVPLRVRHGDDASCLNLNRAQQPTLLGVRPDDLAMRSAFNFVAMADHVDPTNPWHALEPTDEANVIPAIVDQTTAQWALGKSLGDSITYVDEYGNNVEVRIVATLGNSVLQGQLLISDQLFAQHFPSQSGHHAFLIDCPPDQADAVAGELRFALEDVGIEIETTAARLARFNSVENTYLAIFLLLGGIALVLGTAGVGLVVVRSVLERRAELALLRAVGFSRGAVRRMVMWEHSLLIALGIAVGVAAAVAATWPSLRRASDNREPVETMAVILVVVALTALLWTWVAAMYSVRGSTLDALRDR